ncbi:MAG: hydroxyisourate hydrolase [Gammaproteobacteria bacterium]|nr:MAG: hydroxyisourate hydrolase [Gammaproteobacteria bacterium]
MATVSSHILDSVIGTHAAGIRCQLFLLGEPKQLLFDVNANDEGRIAETVSIDETKRGAEFELVIHGADYFAGRGHGDDTIVETVVIRFTIDDDNRRYHLPVMLSPHSYSTWWSG